MLANETARLLPDPQRRPRPWKTRSPMPSSPSTKGAGLDIRWAWEKLLDGQPDGYTLMQDNAIAVLNGDMTPQEAADALQEGLATWYEPAKNCQQ